MGEQATQDPLSKWKPEDTEGWGAPTEYFKVKDGERATFRIVSDPKKLYIHRIPAAGKEHPATCLGEGCPACAKGVAKQLRHAMAVLDRRDKKVKIWEISNTQKGEIYAIAQEYGEPAGLDLVISRKGTRKEDTKYTLMPGKNQSPLTEEEKTLSVPNLDEYYKANKERMDTLLKGELPAKKKDVEMKTEETVTAAASTGGINPLVGADESAV